jgi:TolB-like protein
MTSPPRRRGQRPKTISAQGVEGQRGINFIEKVVLGMNSRWSPSGPNEVGTDGYIELFDPSSHEPLGVTVAVQSKVDNSMAGGHPTFDYNCKRKDLEYWLKGNIPVILVVSSPSSQEGYWIWVQGHFKHGSPTGSTRITFDKSRHRFSPDSWRQLAEVAPPPQGAPNRPKHGSQAIYPSSVVVLPFVSPTRKEKDEALGDGITETLITSLAQIPTLKVIASTSSFALRHTKKDIREIAATLRVRTVLEGSVQCRNDQIRVTAKLVDAETRTPLWSRQYDEPLSDIFRIQDDLARAATTALQGSDMSMMSGGFQPQLGAYEAYMIGRHNLLKHTPDSLERGERHLQEAANLDRRYAEPRVALGRIYLMRAIEGISPPSAMLPMVVQQAQEALQIDGSDPRGHALLGIAAVAQNFDWHLAAGHFSRAFQTIPVAPETRQSFSVYLAAEVQYDRAARMLEKALKDDVLNVFWRGRLANYLNLAENFDRALAEAAIALSIDEHYWLPHYVIAENYVLRERFADALPPAETAYDLAKRNPRVAGLFAGVLAQLGFKERAHAVVGDLSKSSVGLLFFHLVVGDMESAMDALLQALAEHQLFAVLYARSPFTRALRLGSRWSKVVEVMKLRDLADARIHFAEDEET